MRRSLCVLFALLPLLLVAPLNGEAASQERVDDDQAAAQAGFKLEQNYPNPFNPATRIPFELFDEVFVEGQPARVSMRIYNILLQFVASPTALNHPLGDRAPVVELEYTRPGRHEAFWDSRDRNGAQVPSGVYILEMTVNGRSQNLKMFVSR
ncbi:MAG: hypothetical protein EA422_04880 [Gemmatimonadales bacterium]|nr:MAG: hypothetical protein EA422_04880 [Gemmatimonadales bacterium]